MDKSQIDRLRGANYTNFEKALLLKLVNKHRDILINFKKEPLMKNEKAKTWEVVSQEFRERYPEGPYRSAQKLRDKFDDMKKVHRKKVLTNKGTRDKEFYLMKKILSGTFTSIVLPEPDPHIEVLSEFFKSNPLSLESHPDISLIESSNDEIIQNPNEEISYSIETVSEQNKEAAENSPTSEAVEPGISAQEQYFIDKNRREEEEHRIHMQIKEDAEILPNSNSEGRPIISAQEQYYIDKNRREEMEHRMNMEILKLKIEKEKLDIHSRKEAYKKGCSF